MRREKILILTESIDITADKVCRWLRYYEVQFLRINTDKDIVWVNEIEMINKQISISIGYKKRLFYISDFNVIWFRRGMLINELKPIPNNIFPDDDNINNQILRHLTNELNALNEFVYKYINKSVIQINNPLRYNINKLECLYNATKIGLNVPDTFITRKKDKVIKEKQLNNLITKNIRVPYRELVFISNNIPG